MQGYLYTKGSSRDKVWGLFRFKQHKKTALFSAVINRIYLSLFSLSIPFIVDRNRRNGESGSGDSISKLFSFEMLQLKMIDHLQELPPSLGQPVSSHKLALPKTLPVSILRKA